MVITGYTYNPQTRRVSQRRSLELHTTALAALAQKVERKARAAELNQRRSPLDLYKLVEGM